MTDCSYDLSAAVWAPVFGWWSDHTSTFKQQVSSVADIAAQGTMPWTQERTQRGALKAMPLAGACKKHHLRTACVCNYVCIQCPFEPRLYLLVLYANLPSRGTQRVAAVAMLRQTIGG